MSLKNKNVSHILAITAILLIHFGFSKCNAQACKANGDKEWYYDNELPNGPDHWGDDNPDCKGDKQSPIDIQKSEVKPIEDSSGLQLKNYDQPISKVTIENLGYTIKVKPNDDDDTERTVILDGVPYNLKAIYFRWGNKSTNDEGESTSIPGSDHKFDGKQYAMEMQLVHENENQDMVVVGVLFNDSDDLNPTIEAIQKPIDKYKYQGEKYEGDLDDDYCTNINLSDIVLNGSSYFQYNGSLTQPPCKENVTWLLLQNPSFVSTTQLLGFDDLYSVKESNATEENSACHIVNNYRVTQPLNDRTIFSG